MAPPYGRTRFRFLATAVTASPLALTLPRSPREQAQRTGEGPGAAAPSLRLAEHSPIQVRFAYSAGHLVRYPKFRTLDEFFLLVPLTGLMTRTVPWPRRPRVRRGDPCHTPGSARALTRRPGASHAAPLPRCHCDCQWHAIDQWPRTCRLAIMRKPGVARGPIEMDAGQRWQLASESA